jgi:hypothetical protein
MSNEATERTESGSRHVAEHAAVEHHHVEEHVKSAMRASMSGASWSACVEATPATPHKRPATTIGAPTVERTPSLRR